jgi:parallel beta-helix repeat protein
MRCRFLVSALYLGFFLWPGTVVPAPTSCTLAAIRTGGPGYYVAMNGSDSNPGTKDQPFRTLLKAANMVKPGETVLVRAGRYAGFWKDNLNGAPGKPITFAAYPGERATVDIYLNPPGSFRIGIGLGKTCSYLVFDGFEITTTDPVFDELRRLNLKNPEDLAAYLARCQKGRQMTCGHFGVRMESDPAPSHHLVFQNLEIHHLNGIGFSGSQAFSQFINNHVYDLGRPASGYGWYSHTDQSAFCGNWVHHNIFGFHMRTGVSNSLVENNYIYHNGGTYFHGSSNRVSGGGAGWWSGSGDPGNIFRNNVIFNNKDEKGQGYGGLRLLSAEGTRVYNNTLYGNSVGITVHSGVTVRNNIAYRNGKDIEHSGNSVVSDNLTTDPRFVNPDAMNFRLQAGSPAVDKGAAIAEVPRDLDGVSRPQGAGYDIGAFEFKP